MKVREDGSHRLVSCLSVACTQYGQANLLLLSGRKNLFSLYCMLGGTLQGGGASSTDGTHQEGSESFGPPLRWEDVRMIRQLCCENTVVRKAVDDGKKAGEAISRIAGNIAALHLGAGDSNVWYLARDCELVFQAAKKVFTNCRYLYGLNRQSAGSVTRRWLWSVGVRPGDIVVDTGYHGSIAYEINARIPITSVLLSTNYNDLALSRLSSTDSEIGDAVCIMEGLPLSHQVRTENPCKKGKKLRWIYQHKDKRLFLLWFRRTFLSILIPRLKIAREEQGKVHE